MIDVENEAIAEVVADHRQTVSTQNAHLGCSRDRNEVDDLETNKTNGVIEERTNAELS